MEQVILIVIILIVALFLVKGCRIECNQVSSFGFGNSEYQYGNPNTAREVYYYQCLKDECKDNMMNYDCLERCHLKSYRKGMKAPDIKDFVCMGYIGDDKAYYRCLDSVYANYEYP